MLICACVGPKKQRYMFCLSVNAKRIWMRAWDALDKKERLLDAIKRYEEVNEEVERGTRERH